MANTDTQTHFRTCNLCEAMCGVAIETRGNEILSIKGDRLDEFSRGHVCPKAVALKDLHEDPDRLRHPVKKTPQGWQTISWDEAFTLVTKGIRSVQAKYGKDSVGIYLGNPNTHNHGSILMLLPFIRSLRTKRRFSATSNDQLPHMLTNLKMFGHQGLFPIPDIDHTDFFVCMGGNPMASNGSIMTAPDIKKRLKAIQERGGKVVVIDPRRTETAEVADQHLFIHPGADALLLLAVIHVLFEDNLINLGRLTPYVEDIEILQVISEGYTPSSVAKQTGIAAKDIRKLAREFAAAPRAAWYTRMGTSTQQFGTITTWLGYCLNILTGRLDARGGMMFTKPAVDLVELGALAGQTGHFDKYRSRVRKLPEFSGELPSVTMAEEILTEGPGQIRAMVTAAGNPVLSSPDGKQLDSAFAQLDFMFSVDFYINETTRHANVILPPTGPLEHSHYDVVFSMISVRNTAKYSPALFPPEKDTLHDWQIYAELTRRFSSRDLRSTLEAETKYQVIQRLGIDGFLDLLLRTGPYGAQLATLDPITRPLIEGIRDALPAKSPLKKLLEMGPYGNYNRNLPKGLSLDVLKGSPHGIDLGPMQPCFPERLYHPDQKIKLAPKIFVKDLSRLKALRATANADQSFTNCLENLTLIGRRDIRSNNSWMHNSHRLVKGKNRCTLLIHPSDAEKIRLTSGEQVRIASRTGTLEITSEITTEVMPGVVCMPHGWGHHREGVRLGIAQQHAGVSLNDITDPLAVDQLSGTAMLSGIPVRVQKL